MNLGLLGFGVVGSGACRIIDAQDTEELKDIHISKILVKDLSEGNDPRLCVNAEEILNDPDIDVIVECMGGLEPAHAIAAKTLAAGKSFVTSNKKMYATFQQELQQLSTAHGGRIGCEACVGGGIPWLHEVAHTRRIDAISSFRGIMNGTTNYILSGMTDTGAEFDEMLKQAQSLGYAERDPSDDIDGYDVRYKTCISAAHCFDAMAKPEEIPSYGIRNIKAKDIAWARKNQRIIKLIGQGTLKDGALQASVMPVFLHESDAMSRVSSNFNQIELNGATLGRAAFYGQGAGSLPTAHAVVQDIIDLKQNRTHAASHPHACNVDNEAVTGTYYVRTAKLASFTGLIDQKIDEETFLTAAVSMNGLLQAVKNADDPALFLAEVDR